MSFDLKIANGDLVIGSDGDIVQVSDSDKLVQDILKVLITPIGTNKFFPTYGSPISKTLIGNTYDFSFIGSVATNQINSSLNLLKQLQQIQINSGQKVTPKELISAIQDVNVERNQVDPRFFRVYVRVIDRSFTTQVAAFDVG